MIEILQTALLLIFPALVIVAGLKDVTSYTIPNWISLALIAGFFPAAWAAGLPLGDIGVNLGVGLGALVLGMGMFALGWIGGGDAKLFAAAALWLGWPAAAGYMAITGIAGGALAVTLLGLRSSWFRSVVNVGPRWFERLASPGENVPYGVAIAAGALLAFPGSALMQAATQAL